jgi:hypothetical protein
MVAYLIVLYLPFTVGQFSRYWQQHYVHPADPRGGTGLFDEIFSQSYSEFGQIALFRPVASADTMWF